MFTTARLTLSFASEHFDVLRRKDKWPFFWRVSLEGLVVPMVVAVGMSAAFHLPTRTELQQLGLSKLLVWGVVLCPFFETLLLQALPVAIARRCGLRFWGQVVVSIIPFAALHFPSGVVAGICGGLVSGFYIAFTYVHWRQVSFRCALWMTTGTHAVHNLLLFLVSIALGDL